MSVSARLVVLVSVAGLAILAGCSSSHSPTGDAGMGGDASCVGSSSLICVPSCGGDAGLSGICVGGTWQCPPGTVDITTCPPGCIGRPPGPDCVCRGTEWSCTSTTCPSDIDPWGSPGTPCATEGSHCSSGTSDACGSALSCTCTTGHWNCAVAEPDPVCWCGREPSTGDRCSEEGASCGECCPTPGGTGWAAMTCVMGHWQPAACPELVCPPVPTSCPVDRAAALGTMCASDGQICGNACCGSAFQCSGGVWVAGPDALCDCDPSSEFSCGTGSCTSFQACTSQCGPADGIEHTCTPLADGCSSCACTDVPAGFSCEMRDGHVFVSMEGFCG